MAREITEEEQRIIKVQAGVVRRMFAGHGLDREDLEQDAALAMIQHVPEGSPPGMAAIICRRRLIDLIRKQRESGHLARITRDEYRSEYTKLVQFADDGEGGIDINSLDSNWVNRKCHRQFIELDQMVDTLDIPALLEVLTPREKACVEMYFWSDVCLREIGARAGISESRVSQLISRSLAKMRLRLGIPAQPRRYILPGNRSSRASAAALH
jgi:RNA polymerase sigma factor (sigma-70 family)